MRDRHWKSAPSLLLSILSATHSYQNIENGEILKSSYCCTTLPSKVSIEQKASPANYTHRKVDKSKLSLHVVKKKMSRGSIAKKNPISMNYKKESNVTPIHIQIYKVVQNKQTNFKIIKKSRIATYKYLICICQVIILYRDNSEFVTH